MRGVGPRLCWALGANPGKSEYDETGRTAATDANDAPFDTAPLFTRPSPASRRAAPCTVALSHPSTRPLRGLAQGRPRLAESKVLSERSSHASRRAPGTRLVVTSLRIRQRTWKKSVDSSRAAAAWISREPTAAMAPATSPVALDVGVAVRSTSVRRASPRTWPPGLCLRRSE